MCPCYSNSAGFWSRRESDAIYSPVYPVCCRYTSKHHRGNKKAPDAPQTTYVPRRYSLGWYTCAGIRSISSSKRNVEDSSRAKRCRRLADPDPLGRVCIRRTPQGDGFHRESTLHHTNLKRREKHSSNAPSNPLSSPSLHQNNKSGLNQ